MSDLLLVLAFAFLAAAGFVVGLVWGLLALAFGFGVMGLALADGKGFTWRS